MKDIIKNRELGGKSNYIVDFKLSQRDEYLRGIHYPDQEKTIIFLTSHEKLTEIPHTIEHEDLHRCIHLCVKDEDDGFINEHEEHELIFHAMLAAETLA